MFTLPWLNAVESLWQNSIFAGYPRCLQRNYNIHQHTQTCQQMHAVFKAEMQHTLFISAIFLWSNAVCFCRTISLWNIKWSFKWYTMPFGGVQCAFDKISFERGPQGEGGPGLEASKINFDRVFAFVWKTRSKLILGASRAQGTFLARTPFTLGAPFEGNLVISACLTFLSKEQYPF